MGIITRDSNAPIQDGETANAADVENDFATLFAEINGNLTNANLSGSAAITAANMATSTITTAQMAASAVPKANVETAFNNVAVAGGGTWSTINGFSGITLTPGSASDIIEMDFTGTIQNTHGSLAATRQFGFSVDGTDLTWPAAQASFETSDNYVIHFSWAVAAGGTAAIVLLPRERTGGGAAGTPEWMANVYRVFRARIIPTK
jgi:hypothetical protein